MYMAALDTPSSWEWIRHKLALWVPHNLETQNMSPASLTATRPPAPPRGASPQPNPVADFYEPRPMSNPLDFERAADDIIANFRARHGAGLDASSSSLAATAGESSATLTSARATLRASEIKETAQEETSAASSSSRARRMLRNADF
ncbi:hypothetical protein SK128_014619 [Halocaridina rubra]|uniref:Uncharacterized protein n=1 Tax=Halocaridina rubra TaxID=373956 RepID=A0AAN8WUC7_HALRR